MADELKVYLDHLIQRDSFRYTRPRQRALSKVRDGTGLRCGTGDRIAVSALVFAASQPDRAPVAVCAQGVFVFALLCDLS